MSRFEHKQVRIWNPIYKQKTSVDEGIAPLLRAMWDVGIDTTLSCQENVLGSIWIEFEEPDDALYFAHIVMADKDLRNAVLYGHWKWNMNLGDISEDELGNPGEEPCPNIFVSVRFPPTHYDRILSLVTEYGNKIDSELMAV